MATFPSKNYQKQYDEQMKEIEEAQRQAQAS